MDKVILNFNEYQFQLFKGVASGWIEWKQVSSPRLDQEGNPIVCYINIEVNAKELQNLFWIGLLVGRAMEKQEQRTIKTIPNSFEIGETITFIELDKKLSV